LHHGRIVGVARGRRTRGGGGQAWGAKKRGGGGLGWGAREAKDDPPRAAFCSPPPPRPPPPPAPGGAPPPPPASPGLANLLAARSIGELDRATSVVTGWNLAMAQPQTRSWRPSAAITHGIEQISNTIPVIRAGRQVWEKPLRKTVIDYPGLGAAAGWSFGHPEPVTLARTYPDLIESVNVALAPQHVVAVLHLLGAGVIRGVLRRSHAASIAAVAENLMPSGSVGALADSALPPLFALARGDRDGEPATVACALGQVPGLTMAEVTGIPLAVGALMRPHRPGVHPPEAVFTPAEFFTRLAPHCVGRPNPESLTVTTASYAADGANAVALQRGSLITALLTAGR
ncbi:hypothetical protein, partial [Nocardia cyriacigeorgica]|uniref:hypothetical protein n=1 Tax=Nocardia cyriacigeorgica TaxID=135487 RepID=UPI002455EFD2